MPEKASSRKANESQMKLSAPAASSRNGRGTTTRGIQERSRTWHEIRASAELDQHHTNTRSVLCSFSGWCPGCFSLLHDRAARVIRKFWIARGRSPDCTRLAASAASNTRVTVPSCCWKRWCRCFRPVRVPKCPRHLPQTNLSVFHCGAESSVG